MPETPARSLCDVLPSVAALLCVAHSVDALGLVDSIGPVRLVVVVLVDGLGWQLLPQLTGDAPLLASAHRGETGHLAQLVAPFPSTTPTSLVSLGTGVSPGQHGVLGFTLNVPGTDRVLNHIAWRDDPAPTLWQPVPTWFERLRQAGVDACAVLPAAYVGSGLSESAYRGARFRPVEHDQDYAAAVVEQVSETTGLVYAYTSVLDTAAHLFGVGSPEWHAAGAQVDTLLRRLTDALPRDAVLLVTADHGGLNVPPESRIDLDADPRLCAGIRVVAGEPRVRYLHTVPGATADVIATWSELLAGRATVRRRDDAIGAGLFGPVAAGHRNRIGDVVVICDGTTAVLAGHREPPEVARLVGLHGGATTAETQIPLITLRR